MGGAAGWHVNTLGDETNCVGTFEGERSVISVPRNQWQVNNTNCYSLDYRGREGLLYVVENTGNTRSLNDYAGGSGGNYYTYKIVKKGIGKQKVVYEPAYEGHGITVSSQWNIRRKETMNHFTYLQGAMCKSDFKVPTVVASTYNESAGKWEGALPYWKRLTLQSWNNNHINNGGGTGLRIIDEKVSLNDVRNAVGSPGNLGNPMDWINADSKIVSEVVELTKNDCNCVFARGAYMPANKSGYWYYVPKLYTDKNKDQFTVACTNVPNLKSAWGWTLYNDSIDTYASLVPSYPLMMPTCLAGANESFDCNSTDDFSQLPSPLVTYNDSNGLTHYMDEGMFLGNIPKTGEVEFKVKFQNDLTSGTNTGVKLHISKKPFSYDFNNANLINYIANGGTASKEQTLAFGTEYIIQIPDVKKNDQLYMEWVPVTASNLAALALFEDYRILIDN